MRRITTHIHQLPDWPGFRWDQEALAAPLADIRHRQGRLLGRMEGLGFALQKEAELETLTLDVLKSSEIEGEMLDPGQVRSSIARRLGLDAAGTGPADREVEGVVEMMLDATQRFTAPLTDERLFAWHAALFPTGRSGMRKIVVGAWRDDHRGPMQVVSGPVGREKVHYEAPAAPRLAGEMTRFLAWANESDRADAVMRAGIAHLWFVTLHPFDDGNGRIARAIADWQLARSERSAQRFYSMSAQIRRERSEYYRILERTQKGTLDITPWLEWFLILSGPGFRRDRGHARGRLAEGPLLGARRAAGAECPAAPRAEPVARRIHRHAHHAEVGRAGEVLARHCLARHSGAYRPGSAEEERRWRAQHELLAHRRVAPSRAATAARAG